MYKCTGIRTRNDWRTRSNASAEAGRTQRELFFLVVFSVVVLSAFRTTQHYVNTRFSDRLLRTTFSPATKFVRKK